MYEEDRDESFSKKYRLDVHIDNFKYLIDCPKCIYGTLNKVERRGVYLCIDCLKTFQIRRGFLMEVKTKEKVIW